ncbi:MAG: hypothetical protein WDM89_15895 [Rhizomicrobium sp.]
MHAKRNSFAAALVFAVIAACGLSQAQSNNASAPGQASKTQPFIFPDASSKSLWKITARPVSTDAVLGEPVFFDLQVGNLSSKSTRIDLGDDDKGNLRVTVSEPNGLLREVQLRPGGMHAFGTHMVGARATYTKRLILNEWNDLRDVGNYDVKIALVPEFGPKPDNPLTAVFHVSIAPRSESRLSAVAKAFADQAINGRDGRDRDDAAFALSYVDDPIAIPEIERVLASGSDAGSSLTTALAHLGGLSAVEALQAAAKNHPDWSTRVVADRDLRRLCSTKVPAHEEVSD